MTINSEAQGAVRRFHYSRKTRRNSILLALGSSVLAGGMICGGAGGGVVFIYIGLQMESPLRVIPMAIGLLFVLIALIPLSFLLMDLIGFFTNYLEVSPEGIRYHNWGQFKLQARWEDIERIGPYGPFKAIAIVPRNAQITEPLIWRWRRMLFKNPYPVSLQPFVGWPDGELADSIRKYASHLLEEVT
jgi:hypothetical protein